MDEPVTVVGYPNAKRAWSTGVILKPYLDAGEQGIVVFIISAFGDHGSSGSSVFNEYGRVIGILYAVNDETHCTGVIAMNVAWEALKLTNPEHPDGFVTGLTAGVDLRHDEDRLADGDIGSKVITEDPCL